MISSWSEIMNVPPSTSRARSSPASAVVKTSFSTLSLRKCSVTFQWKIDKFHQLQQANGECLESPSFCTPSVNGDILWCIQVYPRGIEKDFRNCIAVYLKCVTSHVEALNLKYRFTIVKANGEVYDPLDPMGFRHAQPNLDAYNYFIKFTNEDCTWGCPDFLRHNEIAASNIFLKKDRLTLRCQIDMNNIAFPVEPPSNETAREIRTLSECLGEQFEQQTVGDITINAGEKSFLVHKNILTCRSPVFKAMFEHETAENTRNIIDIQGMKAEVVREMLYFMYTDEIKNMDLLAKELYEAADKYDIELLKKRCQDHLSESICIDNVAELLIFADFNNITDLKEESIIYINDKASSVIKTDGWATLAREAPHLAVDAYQHLVQSMND